MNFLKEKETVFGLEGESCFLAIVGLAIVGLETMFVLELLGIHHHFCDLNLKRPHFSREAYKAFLKLIKTIHCYSNVVSLL